jgi:hypothetical protein
MTETTETELFDCLIGNLKSARADVALMADPSILRGPLYFRVKEALKLVEGSARQIAHWREDSRWLKIGLAAEVAHQMVRQWVERREGPKAYTFMAIQMQRWLNLVEVIRHAKTGKLGLILPDMGEPDLRDTRPVQVALPDSHIDITGHSYGDAEYGSGPYGGKQK